MDLKIRGKSIMYLEFELGFDPEIDTKWFELIYIDLRQENPKNVFGHTWQERKSHNSGKKCVLILQKSILKM
jgi:hypothetical protein